MVDENIKKIVCSECKDDEFTIDEIIDCSKCVNNGAYDEDAKDYIYDEKVIKAKNLERNQVEENGECLFGTCSENGCNIMTCVTCMHQWIIPWGE